MYLCKKCGNKKYFIETNVYKTYLAIDENTHEPISNNDEFDYMERVECGICEALSEDGDVVTIDGQVISCE